MNYHKCNISTECGLVCNHNEDHSPMLDPRGGPEDCRDRHHCPPMDSMVFCEPVGEPSRTSLLTELAQLRDEWRTEGNVANGSLHVARNSLAYRILADQLTELLNRHGHEG